MKTVMTLLSLTFALHAAADLPAQTVPQTEYVCDVHLFVQDLPGGMGEATFVAPLSGGSHGGDDRTFDFGAHQVQVTVDGKWRNLSWYLNGKLVTAVVSASGDVIAGHQAIILYNPENPDDQLHLSCGPQAKK